MKITQQRRSIFFKMRKIPYDSVDWCVNEVAFRVVAETGIPSDRYHIGKLMLHNLKDDPDFIMQIDGATGQSESNGSVADRSIRCAIAITNLGIKKGDVMVLMAPNHIDLTIPHNAALFLGIMVAPIDATLVTNELSYVFNKNKPNIIFCQSERIGSIEQALRIVGLEAKIVTFDKGSEHPTLVKLLENIDDENVKDYQPSDFDPDSTVAYLLSTSGTTGFPKTAILTHKNLAISIPYLLQNFTNLPNPKSLAIVLSPLQWLSAGLHFLFSPILKYTRLQTSAVITPEHFVYLANKYKPNFKIVSPTLMTTLMTVSDKCDFRCFECILLGGSAVPQELVEQLKVLTKSQEVYPVYGLSEAGGVVFHHDSSPPVGSVGRMLGGFEYRLVNYQTKEEITEPNIPGELWLRGPAVFKGYYNDLEETKASLTEDGWLKSGDSLYRDQYGNFIFVERYKLLLKYKNHQIAPAEIESVIMKHPGVLDVAVTGIPDKECGDLVVACVIPRPGFTPTAQEIKDLVKESLTDSKQLRGGVIFMKTFPTTSTSKINRVKIREMANELRRE